MNLIDKIKKAPRSPGVYLFKDTGHHILYIGKAANLKIRLHHYLNKNDPRNQVLLKRAHDIDVIITQSDTEALSLEDSLIKLHKPRYNVRLKDDKKFPYLKLTAQEPFPRIEFTRDITPDGSLLFGPYTNARALRRTRDALCRIFKLVSCKKEISVPLDRACLEYHMGRCSAPCTGEISKQEYATRVEKAITFLQGNSVELEQEIERTMWQYVKEENFEAATILRDQLVAIRYISQRQQVVSKQEKSRDVIGISRNQRTCVACLFRIRHGRLVAKEVFRMKVDTLMKEDEIASDFIRLIYTHISYVPDELVIRHPRDWEIQKKWFKEKGFTVHLSSGQRGEPRRLLNWAQRNAEHEHSRILLSHRVSSSLFELQGLLQLKYPPRWIEGFDISNIGDKFAVGSSVAFVNGKPYKQRYRRYRIKRVAGQNDYAMIKEIVSRRVKDITKHKEKPDLLLIDGGPGQLHAARQALECFRAGIMIPVFALAKKHDELYDGKGKVVSIPATSKSIYILKQLRDEAHRFAVTYHKKVRRKTLTQSLLDSIDTIGKKKKINLLKYFGSIEALKKASEEDIARTPGIGPKSARIIYETLHN